MSRSKMLLTGAASLVLAVLLGVAVWAGADSAIGIDRWWNEHMVAFRPPALVWAAKMLGTIGGGWMAVALIPALIGGGLLWRRRPRGAAFFVLASVVCALLVQVLKKSLGRDRPEEILVDADFGSFPSGHTANAVVILVVLALLFPRRPVVLVAAVWAVLMAASRTVLSAHWATDVVGGALCGVAVALLLGALLGPWLREEQRSPTDRVE